MKINELHKNFMEGCVSGLYLVKGKDVHLCDLALKEFSEHLPGLMFPELNITVIKENFDLASFKIELQSMPFAGERRLIILYLSAVDNDSAGKLAAEFPVAADSTVLVIVCNQDDGVSGDSDDGKKGRKPNLSKLEKSLKKAEVINCDGADIYSKSDYLVATAAKYRVKFPRSAVQYFLNYINADTETAFNELNKLINVCDGEITKEDIDRYCIRNAEYRVYMLHGYLAGGDVASAKELFDEITRDDQNPVGIVSMLANSFSRMLTARLCMDAGYTADRTAEALRSTYDIKSDGQIRDYIKFAKKYPADRIRSAVKELSDIDYRSKHGEFNMVPDFFGRLSRLYLL